MGLGLGDKVVIVAGGSKSIGLACAPAFMALGDVAGLTSLLASAKVSYLTGPIVPIGGGSSPLL